MSPQFIQLKDVLKIMKTYAPFSIEWVAADIKRKKAGRWFELNNCVLSASNSTKKRGALSTPEKVAPAKNTNARENDTINIMNLDNRYVTTVHLRLIKVFNGKTVIY